MLDPLGFHATRGLVPDSLRSMTPGPLSTGRKEAGATPQKPGKGLGSPPASMLALQTILNVAVCTNLVPCTGISLPLFSYGGTALLIQLGEMGIVLSASREILEA